MSKFIREVDLGHGLTLSCYTKKAFYKKHWTQDTIRARGHVRDKEGNLVSRPFDKIFNVGEHETSTLEYIFNQHKENPDTIFVETEKLNGHLGILFHYDGEWYNTTKGGNHPDIIDRDRDLIEQNFILSDLPPENTYMFEIMDKECDPHVMHLFDDKPSRAKLIGIRETYTGRYVYLKKLNGKKYYDFDEFKDYINELKQKELTEGRVIYLTDSNGYVYNAFKVKTDWFFKMRYYWYGPLYKPEVIKDLVMGYDQTGEVDSDEEMEPVIIAIHNAAKHNSQGLTIKEWLDKQTDYREFISYVGDFDYVN